MPNPSPISLQDAQDLVARYKRYINVQLDQTQFVAFDLSDLQDMISSFASQSVGANAVKVYFGQDHYVDPDRNDFFRLTVIFQPAFKDQNDQYHDVPYLPNNSNSHPYNLGVAAPPPTNSVGSSHYY